MEMLKIGLLIIEKLKMQPTTSSTGLCIHHTHKKKKKVVVLDYVLNVYWGIRRQYRFTSKIIVLKIKKKYKYKYHYHETLRVLEFFISHGITLFFWIYLINKDGKDNKY